MRNVLIWIGLLFLVLSSGACRPQEVVVEKEVTQTVGEQVTEKTVLVETPVMIEKTVVVTAVTTIQVVATLTPTPAPEGGLISRVMYQDARTLNPILADDVASRTINELMFEGMLTVDPFTGAPKPNLAETWSVSDDGLTYTMTIRHGLQWSDGVPITAHDFHFTYRALMSGRLDTWNNKLVADIQDIRVPDDHTAIVTFAHPDCANLDKLHLPWAPMHVFIGSVVSHDFSNYDFAQIATHEFNSTPTVFSGPFKLQEWVRGDHCTVMRNERYWRGRPHLDGVITYIVSGQAEMVQLLKRGQLDVGIGLDPHYLAEVEAMPDLNVLKFLSDEYDLIALQLGDPANPQARLAADGKLNDKHGQHPILQDVRVRQAIAYALDRNALINRARLGQGIPLAANVLPAVSWAYNTDLEPRPYSVATANQLLEQAGWSLNANIGIRSKGGRPLKLKLHTNAGNLVRETMAQVIKEQLKQVGIEIEVVAIDWESLLDVLYGQTFDMALISWSNLGFDPDDKAFWRAANDQPLPGRGDNFVSYYNPEVEEMLNAAAIVPRCDQDARAQLYRQVQAQLYQDQPYIWIDVVRRLVAINRRVGGVNPGHWSVWHNVHEWYVVK